MRVRYSFSSRKTKKLARDNKHKKKFPDLALQVISQADIILEVLDSRFWQKTRSLEIENEIKKLGKKLILVLNKSDMTDSNKLIEELTEKGIYPEETSCIIVSCKTKQGSKKLKERIKTEAEKIDKAQVEIGVVGYPNTGKSSIINLLRGKHVTKTASESGYTKGIQKIRLSKNILLLDTPGVIPKSENSVLYKKDLFKHMLINVRTWDKVKEPEMIVHFLMEKYPGKLEEFYNIQASGDSEVLIEKLGRKMGFLKRGNLVDTDRTSRLIIKDFQEGKIRVF